MQCREVENMPGIKISDAFDMVELPEACREYPALEKHLGKWFTADEKCRMIITAAAFYWLKNDNNIKNVCRPLANYPELSVSAGLVGKPTYTKSEKEKSRALNRAMIQAENQTIRTKSYKIAQAHTKHNKIDKTNKANNVAPSTVEKSNFNEARPSNIIRIDERKSLMRGVYAQLTAAISAFETSCNPDDRIALLREITSLQSEFEYLQRNTIRRINRVSVVCHECEEEISAALEYYYQAAIIKTCPICGGNNLSRGA
jgi:hypothetical protein